jgi:hypothetical protein
MTEAERLKRRVLYFLHSKAYGRQEVWQFANRASRIGEVYIIGGMLRDLHLAGNGAFCSDIDFVLSGCSEAEFAQFMLDLGGVPNRFGGYRVSLRKWMVEMWRLEDTWAHRAGHCSISAAQDLAKATFFDWDAILYKLAEEQLIVEPGYFNRLGSRVLEVRLLHNPNQFGNVVRALRYAFKWNAIFGPRLARLVLRYIVDMKWESLIKYEEAAFRARYLPLLDGLEVERRLRRYEKTGNVSYLGIQSREGQLALPWDKCNQDQLPLNLS